MRQKYDIKIFSERLRNFRQKRKTEYKENQHLIDNPYEKFSVCISQDTFAEKLNVERRTYGRWERGISFPTLDKVMEICYLLDCNIDYLLGADDLEGISPTKIASKYSSISENIIRRALDNSSYRDCLNYFMDPDNCSALFNNITLTSWRECCSEHNIDFINEPLKTLIKNIFDRYIAVTLNNDYNKESFKNFLLDELPPHKFTFSRKQTNLINVCSCIPKSIVKNLSLNSKNSNSYNAFIDYIVNVCYTPLYNNAFLEVRKNNLGKAFINLFEKYLHES